MHASICQRAMACCLGLAAMAAAQADVVTDWNLIAAEAGYKAGGDAQHARAMVLMHRAMSEAVNSIGPRYMPYRQRLQAEPGASADAAAAVAAHHVLRRIYPQQVPSLDVELLAALTRGADGEAKAAGIRVGDRAAALSLAEGAVNGPAAPDICRPFPPAGGDVPIPTPMHAETRP